MKSRAFSIELLLSLLIIVYGCGDSKKTETEASESTAFVPVFNADSAYEFINNQVLFGPRVPNTSAHFQCGEYIIQTLKTFEASVTVQEFDAKRYDNLIMKSRNIIGSYNPEASKRVILAAHWDTRFVADKDSKDQNKPIDGANDGGSGVGVLLEVARLLKDHPINIGVDIIFFDAEDQGTPENMNIDPERDTWCLGSQYWSKNKHVPEYSAFYGVLLDMVGSKDAKFAKDGTSRLYAGQLQRKIWETARMLGYGNYFIMKETQAITDDHFYVNVLAKIPMVDIIEYNEAGNDYFGPYHHTHEDNMDLIDRNTLKAVGHTVTYLIYNE